MTTVVLSGSGQPLGPFFSPKWLMVDSTAFIDMFATQIGVVFLNAAPISLILAPCQSFITQLPLLCVIFLIP